MSGLSRLLILLLVPCATLLGLAVLAQNLPTGADLDSLARLCSLGLVDAETDRGACNMVEMMPVVERLALLGVVLALGTPGVFLLAAAVAGTRSRWNAAILRAMLPVAVFGVALNVMVQGALLLGDVYLALAFTTGIVRFPYVAAIVLLLLVVTFYLVMAALLYDSRFRLRVAGVLLGPYDARALRDEVDEIARAVGAPRPEHVVVGLEPEIWIVAGQVDVMTGDESTVVEAGVLHLSAPLLRVLSPDELRALIAHELANFRPGEIAFTTRFLPLRRVLMNPETSTSGQIGSSLRAIRALTVVGRVPTRALLWLLGAAFSANARRAGKRRERAADRIAVEIAGGAALRRALMRIAVFAKAWDEAAQAEIAALARGRLPTVPMPQRFEDRIRYVHDRTWFRARERVAPRTASDHPLDLHSVLRTRLRALGLSITPEDRQHTRAPATPSARTAFLTDADDIETVLSGAEHMRLYRAGLLPRAVPGLAPRDMSAADRAILSFLADLVLLGVDAPPRFGVAAKALVHLQGAVGPDDLLDILSGRGMALERARAASLLAAHTDPERIGHLLETAILMASSSRSTDPGDETRCLATLADARDSAARRVRVA